MERRARGGAERSTMCRVTGAPVLRALMLACVIAASDSRSDSWRLNGKALVGGGFILNL